MIRAHRNAIAIAGAIVAILVLTIFCGTQARAQVGKLINVNSAAESELLQLPNMTQALAKSTVARRPFKTIVELNTFLLDQKLTPVQTKAFYAKAFIPINLNTGTKDEFLLIPGVGNRMSAEFEEYRPWKTWAQFDKEIGKYVGQLEVDRLKQYFFIR